MVQIAPKTKRRREMLCDYCIEEAEARYRDEGFGSPEDDRCSFCGEPIIKDENKEGKNA